MSGIIPSPVRVTGIGTVIIPVIIDRKVEKFQLDEVRHVPDIGFNLLLTTRLDLDRYTHTGSHGIKSFYDSEEKLVLQGFLYNRTYYLDTMWHQPIRSLRLKSSEAPSNDTSWTQWHIRFGHLGI